MSLAGVNSYEDMIVLVIVFINDKPFALTYEIYKYKYKYIYILLIYYHRKIVKVKLRSSFLKIIYRYFEKGCRKKCARDNPERQYGI